MLLARHGRCHFDVILSYLDSSRWAISLKSFNGPAFFDHVLQTE